MKSKSIKSYNLPEEREVSYIIDAKPYFLIFSLALLGFILSVINDVEIFGLTLITIGIFATLFLPRRILMEFSEDYVVLYNKANHSDCVMVYYDDIVTWSYQKRPNADELIFELEDGSSQVVECFDRTRIEKIMELYASGKKKKVGKKK